MVKFSSVGEAVITRAIVEEFAKEFNNYVESDCIIIGAGPSGLVAGRDLANAGKKVVIVERNNYLGGGFWSGGYLMPKITVRHPAEKLLDELLVPYKNVSKGLAVCDAPLACSSLIAAACKAGVKVFNMTALEDIVIKDGKVCGAVINWAPIASLPRQIAALDPVAIEAKRVVGNAHPYVAAGGHGDVEHGIPFIGRAIVLLEGTPAPAVKANKIALPSAKPYVAFEVHGQRIDVPYLQRSLPIEMLAHSVRRIRQSHRAIQLRDAIGKPEITVGVEGHILRPVCGRRQAGAGHRRWRRRRSARCQEHC